MQVYIEGALRTRKWADQSGQDRYTTEVMVNVGSTMQLLGGRYQTNNPGSSASGGWGNLSNWPTAVRRLSCLQAMNRRWKLLSYLDALEWDLTGSLPDSTIHHRYKVCCLGCVP